MKIWIDLDNTPHIPFFKPIIRELENRGHEIVLTARDAFQVCELADLYGLRYKKIGRHYGKNPVFKVLGLCFRTIQLLGFLWSEKPALGLSHGSRAQILLCNLFKIPTIMVMDYEHAETPLMLQPKWEIIPTALLTEDVQVKAKERILSYEGIKEDVYAPEFVPDDSLCKILNINPENITVTVRPPANEAHYHNPESDVLFNEFMNVACSNPNVNIILLPRNKAQEALLRQTSPEWFVNLNLTIPKQAVNGLNLLWHSDLVVSGGGTMNREAAALGVPVYSIFRGKTGAVDRQLQDEGRLVLIENVEQVKQKIHITHRVKNTGNANLSTSKALDSIVNHVVAILAKEYPNNTVNPG